MLYKLFNNCKTVIDYINVVRKLNKWQLDIEYHEYNKHLYKIIPKLTLAINNTEFTYKNINNIYTSLIILFDDIKNPKLQQIQIYTARTNFAINLLKLGGWDFNDPKRRAELIGFNIINWNGDIQCKLAMTHIYLSNTNGREWINRSVSHSSGDDEDVYNTTMLVIMVNYYLNNEIIPNSMFNLALEYGADPNIYYDIFKYETPLAFACKIPNSYLVGRFLECGAAVDREDISKIVSTLTIEIAICNTRIAKLENDNIREISFGKTWNEYMAEERDILNEYRACAILLINTNINMLLPSMYVDEPINFMEQIDVLRLDDVKEKYKYELHHYGTLFNCMDRIVYDAIYHKIIQMESNIDNIARYIKWLILVIDIIDANIKFNYSRFNKLKAKYCNPNKKYTYDIITLHKRVKELVIWKIIDMVNLV